MPGLAVDKGICGRLTPIRGFGSVDTEHDTAKSACWNET